MAAPASWAATWCVRWRGAATASASRCAGPNSPTSCSRSGGSGRFTPCRPTCATPNRSLATARDAEVLINLVGILYERGPPDLRCGAGLGRRRGRRRPPRRWARASSTSRRSAPTRTAPRTMRAPRRPGEQLALATVPSATIFRPSIVFGPEDDFFNKFAALARISPVLPLVGGGHTRFQPVFAGDVANAIALAVDGKATPGTIYELGGPEVKTFRELMQYVLAHHRAVAPAGADPVRARQVQGVVPAVHAEAAAHPRSGRIAARGYRGVGGRQGRGPHLRGPRHRPGHDRGRRAVVSLALPQDRPVRRPAWPETFGRSKHNRAAHSVRSPPPCGEGLGVGPFGASESDNKPHPACLAIARQATLPTRGRVKEVGVLQRVVAKPRARSRAPARSGRASRRSPATRRTAQSRAASRSRAAS